MASLGGLYGEEMSNTSAAMALSSKSNEDPPSQFIIMKLHQTREVNTSCYPQVYLTAGGIAMADQSPSRQLARAFVHPIR